MSSEVTRKNGGQSDMAYLLAFTHGLWKQSATDVRCWSWIGKGREGRGAVARVWIRRLGELWVAAEAFA